MARQRAEKKWPRPGATGGCGNVCPASDTSPDGRACPEAGRCLSPPPGPWVMTPEQIAAHQVRVTRVRYLGTSQTVTGDWWMTFQAPDGEICEVRTACGKFHFPDTPRWTRKQAEQHAVTRLNQSREARAQRVASGLPVTCRLAR